MLGYFSLDPSGGPTLPSIELFIFLLHQARFFCFRLSAGADQSRKVCESFHNIQASFWSWMLKRKKEILGNLFRQISESDKFTGKKFLIKKLHHQHHSGNLASCFSVWICVSHYKTSYFLIFFSSLFPMVETHPQTANSKQSSISTDKPFRWSGAISTEHHEKKTQSVCSISVHLVQSLS